MKSLLFILLSSICLALFSSTSSASNQDQIINAVVNIELNKVVPWDEGFNASGFGTGFVIDSEKGLILTNKHIVNVGPIVAYAEFANKRKLSITPIYRDPIHDFGIFKYNVNEINDLSIIPIKLSTDASVGQKIRLYGNDGGEALSIIEGVLSRLDREPPVYNNTNNDHNTYYMQEALGTSGGSSGSPILNDNNEAIAINAGGRVDTATAFFLPMKMIKPIIDNVINEKPVNRGSLQVVFEHVPFNQMTRLGIKAERIKELKQALPGANGRLLVTHIVKQSPAETHLKIGDLIHSIDDVVLDDFYTLESKLNNRVNQNVKIIFERENEIKQAKIQVTDLFSLVPTEYIEYGKTVFTPIGIGAARLFNVPISGVLITSEGRVFGGQSIRSFVKVDSINENPINSLDDLKTTLTSIPNNQKFSIRYRYLYDQKEQRYTKVRNLANFYINRHCKNVIGKQFWQCNKLPPSTDSMNGFSKKSENEVSSPFVDIEVIRPLEVNVNGSVIQKGMGLILDVDAGLILTGKGIIDSSLSQVNLYFNNGTTLAASVSAIHPYLNLVLLSADLSSINIDNAKIPSLELSRVNEYESVLLKGRTTHIDFETEVSKGWPVLNQAQINFDSYDFSYITGDFSIYTSEDNRLLALAPGYSEKEPFDVVIPLALVLDFVHSVTEGKTGRYQIKDQLTYVSYAEALELGLERKFAQDIARKVFVQKAAELENSGLASGDIILEVNSEKVTTLNEVYLSLNAASHKVKVLRNGGIKEIVVKPSNWDYLNINKVLIWGGGIIHSMPLAINTPFGPQKTCIRLGYRYYGASVYSAIGGDPVCIIALDNQPIDDVGQLFSILKEKQTGDFTKILAVRLDKNFQIEEYRVREENYYWPTVLYSRDEAGWTLDSNLHD
ncbi:trypsin-like peptidase domain-containing protein [Glaciecola sp. 1036]|uniref:trypsin-like peptidase domain-containing protein n=1 Tax=Alteromonadaceae TaxID=72275 RepID=UPI003D00E194